MLGVSLALDLRRALVTRVHLPLETAAAIALNCYFLPGFSFSLCFKIFHGMLFIAA